MTSPWEPGALPKRSDSIKSKLLRKLPFPILRIAINLIIPPYHPSIHNPCSHQKSVESTRALLGWDRPTGRDRFVSDGLERANCASPTSWLWTTLCLILFRVIYKLRTTRATITRRRSRSRPSQSPKGAKAERYETEKVICQSTGQSRKETIPTISAGIVVVSPLTLRWCFGHHHTAVWCWCCASARRGNSIRARSKLNDRRWKASRCV